MQGPLQIVDLEQVRQGALFKRRQENVNARVNVEAGQFR